MNLTYSFNVAWKNIIKHCNCKFNQKNLNNNPNSGFLSLHLWYIIMSHTGGLVPICIIILHMVFKQEEVKYWYPICG